MEPTSINPDVVNDGKPATTLPFRGRLLRTRHVDRRLAPLPERPRILSRAFAGMRNFLTRLWQSLLTRARRPQKKLIVSDSAALGDRRFVSVVQVGAQRFLIGSSPASVNLLSRLPDAVDDSPVPSDAARDTNRGSQ